MKRYCSQSQRRQQSAKNGRLLVSLRLRNGETIRLAAELKKALHCASPYLVLFGQLLRHTDPEDEVISVWQSELTCKGGQTAVGVTSKTDLEGEDDVGVSVTNNTNLEGEEDLGVSVTNRTEVENKDDVCVSVTNRTEAENKDDVCVSVTNRTEVENMDDVGVSVTNRTEVENMDDVVVSVTNRTDLEDKSDLSEACGGQRLQH